MLARFVTSCVVVAVAGLALMPEAASAQKRGGTLVMLVQPEPPTLASNISTSGPIGQVATKVYEDLLEYDFALKPGTFSGTFSDHPYCATPGRNLQTPDQGESHPSPSPCYRLLGPTPGAWRRWVLTLD